MSPAGRAWCLAAAVCATVLVADQVAKRLVEERIAVGEDVDVLGPLRLTLTHNEGVAFGLAGGSGAPLVALTVLALGVVAYLFARQPERPLIWLGAGLLAGGALGNLLDRIRAGAVTDFIELPHWPAFNLADAAITCGVLVLVAIYLREAERGRR
ncbi:MAG: signal peptidase II [Solirubrobacterales bacterium]